MWIPIILAMVARQGMPWSPVGEYIASLIDEGSFAAIPKGLVDWRLSLKADGTFNWHMIDHLMINIDETASGTYTVVGGHVHLKGKATGFSDDGYKREPVSPSFDADLVVSGTQLIYNASSPAPTVFTLVGTRPTIPAGLGPVPVLRNPRAVELLKRTERTYRGLKSYSDMGIVLENHHNYAAQTSRFSTYFVGPATLRFSVQIVEAGKSVAAAEVWTNGKKVRHFDSLDDYTGVQTGAIAGGMAFEIGQHYGTEAEVVPSLLRGEGFPMGSARQIVLLNAEKLQGAKCWVVRTDFGKESAITYWIDSATHLIVKVLSRDVAGTDEITVRPLANPSITAKQMAPTEPAKP